LINTRKKPKDIYVLIGLKPQCKLSSNVYHNIYSCDLTATSLVPSNKLPYVKVFQYCTDALISIYSRQTVGAYFAGLSSEMQTGKHSTIASGSGATKYGIE